MDMVHHAFISEFAPTLYRGPRDDDPPAKAAPPVSENTGRVSLRAVSKSYTGATGPVTALNEVSLEIAPGEIFAVIGRSGAGKSTLIRTINRLETPSSGSIWVGDVEVTALPERDLPDLRHRIGMIFQHFNLLSAKTVGENVALPLRIAGVDKKLIAGKVDALLDLVGLADKRDAYPAQLSGGQKQRVGIARALVHDPEILLCDEATSALDPETTLSILDLLRDINRRLGLTIILITHEMAVVRQIADRVAVLDQGEVVEQGPVWSIFADPQSETTRRLLRSVIADVPRDISDRLRYTPVAAGEVLLRVHLSDRAHGLGAPLDGLAEVLSRPVRLLQADLDRIQGRSQGSLLLITPFRSTSDTEALVRDLRGKTAAVEVLGYVESAV